MPTLFDELSELWVKLAPAGEKPIQWIYNVDDAWFHPGSWDVKIDGRGPVFERHLIGKTLDISREMLPKMDPNVNNSTTQGPDGEDPSEWLKHTLSSPDGSAANAGLDHDTLLRLVRFVLDQSDMNRIYGLCFCSFEYFWSHAQEIDNHLNAIFFDIRHRLALVDDAKTLCDKQIDMSKLRKIWDENLAGTNLFTRKKGFSPEQLGWFLHYALKFNRIGSASGSRPEIGYDHIQILSSAINPILGKADAMSDYVAVQQEIWEAMQGKTDGITSAQFGFSPIPKGGLMDTGLAIFNNSYKNVGSWPAMRGLLLNDLKRLWNDYEDGGCERGHHAHTAKDLCCDGWVLNDDRIDTLRGTHFFHNEDGRSESIGARSLLKFLLWALLRDDLRLPNDCEDWRLLFPTNPGVSYLIGIADLYERMSVPKGDREKPNVDIITENDNCLIVQFNITNGGSVRELLKLASDKPQLISCRDKSAGAYLRLKHASRVLVHHLDNKTLDDEYIVPCIGISTCICTTRRKILECKWCQPLPVVQACDTNNTISAKFVRTMP